MDPVAVAAMADTAAELLQPFAAEGLPAYADAAELIADPSVGTVSVCLPHDLHFPVALRALQAGKNVLVEKPLAIDPGAVPGPHRRRAGQRREARRIA
jgi:predicted dehydrogenase